MMTRRNWMRGAGALLATRKGFAADFRIAGQESRIALTNVSACTFRLTIAPVQGGKSTQVPVDGSLVEHLEAKPGRAIAAATTVKTRDASVAFLPDTLEFHFTDAKGAKVQELKIDKESGIVSFPLGTAPLLGLGEGGPQFDRRGSIDRMRSGQGGYQLRTHGGRVPIPWLIGTSGWAMFFHQPFGTFDFTGTDGKFQPPTPAAALPLDLFLVVSSDPVKIMAEYAAMTGYAELPPLWSFGYQQSHRTLASREEVLNEAKTFREKKLPCDTLIYLGTGFCPSGWNTNNGEFGFNQKVFPDPKVMFDELHAEHFKVALHVVIKARSMHGTVRDTCDPQQPVEEQASCYWDVHREVFKVGVDGWWPDEGDPLNIASRLVRNRMYWEGPQLDRPNERPFALHRNGYAGMQRYASFLWSGDVYSTWETLKVHIPIAVNTGLTGIPYWGTDIGGFVPTKEFTAEMYLRWFQFAAFCPLFRSHGRAWKLRLPWGWNTGDPGPTEINTYNGASLPGVDQLHNAQVEPICRKYLELRYRMLPYLYSAARECTKSGLPIMRALWLHYPDDATAVARGDQFLWGRDILVAPVVEQGATSREVYLPHGAWYDFWTSERFEGGKAIQRKVDLETTPLFVRAGGIVPLGPVKQYTDEQSDQPTDISIYPGADGSFLLYQDDGRSFNYRKGGWMGIQMAWLDTSKTLTMRLAKGSKIAASYTNRFDLKLGTARKSVTFTGRPIEIKF